MVPPTTAGHGRQILPMYGPARHLEARLSGGSIRRRRRRAAEQAAIDLMDEAALRDESVHASHRILWREKVDARNQSGAQQHRLWRRSESRRGGVAHSYYTDLRILRYDRSVVPLTTLPASKPQVIVYKAPNETQ